MAYEYQGPTQGIRLAVEFLNVWMESDRLAAAAHIAKVLEEPDGPDPIYAISGLLDLSNFLIYEIAKTRGATDKVTFNALAREYLANLSANLPD